MSRLIMIFTVCLVNFFINELWNKQGGFPYLVVCPTIPEFTLLCLWIAKAIMGLHIYN